VAASYEKKALLAHLSTPNNMPPKIDKNIQIGELVMNYPQSVDVLFNHGFHCIGCGLSAYETLEQGALAHGFDEATVEEIIQQIKDAVKNGEAALRKQADTCKK
jgi:hybrid cluster-associated redox disulfide protein